MLKNLAGFHLMEILICLAILSILTALTVPLFDQYFMQTNRLAATQALSRLAIAMEEYLLANNSYLHASLEKLSFPATVAKESYALVIQASDNSYVLKAIPQGKQAIQDTECGILTLNEQGIKNISGKGNRANCW